MRIAIITAGTLPVPATKGGAVEVLTQYIIDGFLEKTDYNIDVYTIDDKSLINYPKHANLNILKFKYNQLEFFICRCINYIYKLLKKDIVIFPYDLKITNSVKKYQYDYIIVENNLCLYRNVYKKVRKNNKDTKFIFHIHNTINDFRSKKAYEFVVNTADKVIYVSKFLKKSCDKICKNPNAKILYNCVDFEKFNINNYIRKSKINLKIKRNDLVFLYTGRLTPEKGILELIKAFNMLSKEYDNIKLIIVGSKKFGVNKKDSYFDELEKEIASDNIQFTGYIHPNNMPKYLSLADIVVIPSKCEESFGVVALEAMAMKKAIIATNSGGIVEPLNDDCAIIIKRDENLVYSLYEAMKKMYLDKELRKKLANNGYETCHNVADFNKLNYYDNFFSILNEKK